MKRASKTAKTLVLLLGAALAGCAGGGGDEVDEPIDTGEEPPVTEPDDGDDDGQDDPPDEPTASPYADLPACEGAQSDYTSAGVVSPVEVVDFFGPNISLTLGFSEDVAVIYPAGNEFGTGTFDVDQNDEWTVELCIDWDDETATCEATIPAVEGFVRLTRVEEDEIVDYQVKGSLDGVYFADDADDPTCASRVDYSFQFPLD